uniref:60S acidic ribosomal protein P2A-like n=1 Tax=Elaeis guineensis var. tenera TaxID=51953 RepID=A0A6I9SJ73_ELAGV|nr:60S acidic ribosomal protein P2A-like [Elaeis guineensis]
MKVIAAYLLAVLDGNSNPSSDDLKDILVSVTSKLFFEFLLSEVKGKNITELIACGREKFASVPSGGGAIAVAAPSGGGPAAAPTATKPKKEEKVEEKEESDDVVGKVHRMFSREHSVEQRHHDMLFVSRKNVVDLDSRLGRLVQGCIVQVCRESCDATG